MQKPPVCSIQHSKPVLARLYLQIREDLAIYQQRISENFRHPRFLRITRNRIVQLTFEIKNPIVDRQRNFVLALRKSERVFKFIAHKKYAQQSRKNI